MKKIKNDFDLKDLETDYGFKYKDLGHWQGYIYKNNVICVELESREIVEVNIKDVDDIEKIKELYDDGIIVSRNDLIKEWAVKNKYTCIKTDLVKGYKHIDVNNIKCYLSISRVVDTKDFDSFVRFTEKEIKELEQDLKSLKEYLGE